MLFRSDSIKFVYAIHKVEVDLRPYKASSRKGEVEYNPLIANKHNVTSRTYSLYLNNYTSKN